MCVDRFYYLCTAFQNSEEAFQNIHCKNGVLGPTGMRTSREWKEN